MLPAGVPQGLLRYANGRITTGSLEDFFHLALLLGRDILTWSEDFTRFELGWQLTRAWSLIYQTLVSLQQKPGSMTVRSKFEPVITLPTHDVSS